MKRDRINVMLTIPVKTLLAVMIILIHGRIEAQRTNLPDLLRGEVRGEVGKQQQEDIRERRVTISLHNTTLEKAMNEIAQSAGLKLTYSRTIVPVNKKIDSFSVKGMSVGEALNKLLDGTKFIAIVRANGRGVITEAGSQQGNAGSEKQKNIDNIIKGRVVDSASKNGIPGVMVSVPGTEIRTITDKNGVFVLSNVPANRNHINFKLLGYASAVRTIENVNKGDDLLVMLVPAATSLNEVVTTATGFQRRVEIPSDIVKIDAEKIRQRAPVRSLTDMLEAAQIPGVLVTRASGDPGAATRVRIRGIGSISQSNDPVYIVDGMWIDGSVQSPSRIDLIDQETIETIEVVRGPSAATLYGQDASNGVIVITTKKGLPGITRWNFGYSSDWGRAYGKMPLVYEGLGYNQITGERVLCPVSSVLAFVCVQDSVGIYDPNSKLILREGQERQDAYSLSFDGGAKAVKYSVAASTRNVLGVRRAAPIDLIRLRKMNQTYDKDILKPSRQKNHALSSNLSLYPRDNLDIVLTVKAAYSDLIDNRYKLVSHVVANPINPDTINFLNEGSEFSEIFRNMQTRNTVFGSSITWRHKHGINVTGNGGLDHTTANETGSTRKYGCGLICGNDIGSQSDGMHSTTVASLRTNVSTMLTRGRLGYFIELQPRIGFDFRNVKRNNFNVSRDSIPGGEPASSGRIGSALGTVRETTDAGWYLSSTVGILRKLYFDIGLRQDIGSAIKSSSNTTYPKLGGAWLVSDEGFWPENNFISIFRLRGGIGHAAVQPDVGDIKGRFVTGTRYIDGKVVKSLELTNIGNSELMPERAVELEVGFDLDVWYDRISVIATYAHKENKNALVSRKLPSSFGRGSDVTRKENIGLVQNRSLEMSVNGIAVDKSWLRLVLDYSHTISDNRVKSLGPGTTSISRSLVGTGITDAIVVGYPLGSVFKRTPLAYMDENGDGLISISEIVVKDGGVYVGTSNPRYRGSYGINTTMWNRLVIDSRFSYQSDYAVDYNSSISGRKDYGFQDVNAPLYLQAQAQYQALNVDRISDFRWNSASISYVLPAVRISSFDVRSMSISLQGTNLGLWTKFGGRDPWVNTGILSGSEVMRVDQGSVPPPPRKFALNIKMGL